MISKEEFEAMESINRFSATIHKKIGELRLKIYQKRGYLFVTHKYAREELLKDDTLNSINGILNNLYSNVIEWGERNGGYSPYFLNKYHENQSNIQNALNEITAEIKNRIPSQWERVAEGLRDLITFFLRKLPDIALRAIGLPSIEEIKKLHR